VLVESLVVPLLLPAPQESAELLMIHLVLLLQATLLTQHFCIQVDMITVEVSVLVDILPWVVETM
jgi:hypothetical protein